MHFLRTSAILIFFMLLNRIILSDIKKLSIFALSNHLVKTKKGCFPELANTG